MKIQINGGRIYESAVLFLGTDFLRVTEKDAGSMLNTYYGWEEIASIRTYSVEPEE